MTASIRVLTWNVLHRVHAVNWSEAPVVSFPDERVRLERIAERLVELSPGLDVVSLQEVSGDQLVRLRAGFANADLHTHRHPRMPALRRPPGHPSDVLDDPTEHLVTIVLSGAGRGAHAAAGPGDPGKGILGVELERSGAPPVEVIGAHVSFGDRGAGQLAMIAARIATAKGPVVVLGDFNASADVVAAALGPDVAVADLAGLRPTRIATGDRSSRTIDHVVVARATILSADVLDGRGLSDHNPVVAEIRLDA